MGEREIEGGVCEGEGKGCGMEGCLECLPLFKKKVMPLKS